MRKEGHIFTCYTSMWDTIFYSELGSSLAILNAGYNLDSFMARYQGVNWREKANWECNSRCAPHGEHLETESVSLNLARLNKIAFPFRLCRKAA